MHCIDKDDKPDDISDIQMYALKGHQMASLHNAGITSAFNGSHNQWFPLTHDRRHNEKVNDTE